MRTQNITEAALTGKTDLTEITGLTGLTGLAGLKELIKKQWPQTVSSGVEKRLVFASGLAGFDALFPLGGIPHGQLIEITGPVSSGKTSLLFRLLSHLTQTGRAAYVDFGGNFFPSAASATAIDLSRLLLVSPGQSDDSYSRGDDITTIGIRTAEMLLDQKAVRWLVCDLVGQRRSLSITLLHRLRLKTVRAGALTIFLTEGNSDIIPSSMASLRLAVSRSGDDHHRVRIDVVKSRISREGMHVELAL